MTNQLLLHGNDSHWRHEKSRFAPSWRVTCFLIVMLHDRNHPCRSRNYFQFSEMLGPGVVATSRQGLFQGLAFQSLGTTTISHLTVHGNPHHHASHSLSTPALCPQRLSSHVVPALRNLLQRPSANIEITIPTRPHGARCNLRALVRPSAKYPCPARCVKTTCSKHKLETSSRFDSDCVCQKGSHARRSISLTKTTRNTPPTADGAVGFTQLLVKPAIRTHQSNKISQNGTTPTLNTLK